MRRGTPGANVVAGDEQDIAVGLYGFPPRRRARRSPARRKRRNRSPASRGGNIHGPTSRPGGPLSWRRCRRLWRRPPTGQPIQKIVVGTSISSKRLDLLRRQTGRAAVAKLPTMTSIPSCRDDWRHKPVFSARFEGIAHHGPKRVMPLMRPGISALRALQPAQHGPARPAAAKLCGPHGGSALAPAHWRRGPLPRPENRRGRPRTSPP